MKQVVAYINQFFGQIGGEEHADYAPALAAGAVGPAVSLQSQLVDAEITHTIICGDNYMADHTQKALEEIGAMLDGLRFDFFVAGPAFLAGRYGSNCGHICKYVKDRYHVPVLTCMNRENPGVEMYHKEFYILEGGASASKMRTDLPRMARFANKLLRGEAIGCAEEEGYFPRGVRAEVVLPADQTADRRAFDMLLRKLRGEPFQTESPIDIPRRVPIAPALTDAAHARIAFVSTGGVVPLGNPDRITTGTADHYGKYAIDGQENLLPGAWESVHGGYDHAFAAANPMTHLPLDALRRLEGEGKIGALYPYFYCTVGNLNSETNAVNMARGILQDLKDQNISAIIVGSA